ncbi:MAG: hypothetical protein QOH31_5602 [Verrucomicrobiota bacterium]|jgi:hypothetical protein
MPITDILCLFAEPVAFKKSVPEDALNGSGLPRPRATVDELLLHGEANSAESRS